MIGHIRDLAPGQQRELLALLTQESADLQTDEEVLAELSETLRRQLSLSTATDLAEGFRRRMIRIAKELSEEDHPPGYFDFRSDRAIAVQILILVDQKARMLSAPDADAAFKADFTKTFQTMPQDRRARWLRVSALAATADESGKGDAQRAAVAARLKGSAQATAEKIASDLVVADAVYTIARDAVAAGAAKAAPPVGIRAPTLRAAAAPLGLLAGGAVAFAVRHRRKAAKKRADDEAVVQVRRERQATQAVVTTCAYIVGALDSTKSPRDWMLT